MLSPTDPASRVGTVKGGGGGGGAQGREVWSLGGVEFEAWTFRRLISITECLGEEGGGHFGVENEYCILRLRKFSNPKY